MVGWWKGAEKPLWSMWAGTGLQRMKAILKRKNREGTHVRGRKDRN